MTRDQLVRTLTLTAALLLVAPAALAGGFVLREHGFYVVDFLVMIGIIYAAAKGPAKKFLLDRHDAVRREMDEATALKARAQERLDRYERLVGELEGEIASMRQTFREAGEREAERIATEAAARAERIRKDTATALASESAQLKLEIEHQVAEHALERAEALVRQKMNADQQKQLVRAFIDDLESRGDLSSFTA